MVQLPENMINGYELYITTELPYTFKKCNNSGKIRIDLTFVKVLKNVQVKAKEFELIKIGHLAIEILIEDTQNNKDINQSLKQETGIIGKNT